VAPIITARNLGTWFDSQIDMSIHITKPCSSALYYLNNIRHIGNYLSRECSERLAHAFITRGLEYSSSLLYSVPEYQIRKLQRVMNASSRLIFTTPKCCHVTPILHELHWLPVRLRIDFKILLTMFKIFTGSSTQISAGFSVSFTSVIFLSAPK